MLPKQLGEQNSKWRGYVMGQLRICLKVIWYMLRA